MVSPYYVPSGNPATGAPGSSATVRAEFAAIAAGFGLLPQTLTANKAFVVNAGGTAIGLSTGDLSLGGNLTLASGKNLTISNTLTFTGTDGSSVNFGTGGTVLYSGGTGFVSSVAGTANEITASPTTGAVTLSLPATLTFTGKTVTGGTFTNPTISGTVAGAHSYSGAITLSSTLTFGGQTISAVTGTSSMVLSNSPTLVSPVLGVATATQITATKNGASTSAAFVAAGGGIGQVAGYAWNFSAGLADTGFWGMEANNSGIALTTYTDAGVSGTTALSIGRTGTTLTLWRARTSTSFVVCNTTNSDPVFQVDASAASVGTGIKITGAAAASGVALAAISTGTNENLTIDAKGSGTITLGGTSTGVITLTRAATFSADATFSGNGIKFNGVGTAQATPGVYYQAPTLFFTGGTGGFNWVNAANTVLLANLNNSGALQLSTYGAGSLTTDASGNVTAISDPSQKIFVRRFKAGLPELVAISDSKFMGLHKWKKSSGMETSGVYASFFAHDAFPIKEAVSKGKSGVNTFSDRPVLMAVVNAMSEIDSRLKKLEGHT